VSSDKTYEFVHKIILLLSSLVLYICPSSTKKFYLEFEKYVENDYQRLSTVDILHHFLVFERTSRNLNNIKNE